MKKSPEFILQDPNFFLQKIDPATNKLEFIRTTRDILSSTAFIDGRTDLTSGHKIFTVDIQDALLWQKEIGPQSTTDRFIFHMSFCGSTLLARACDMPGRAFAYKEPQVLIDLATLKAQKHPLSHDQDNWKGLINLTLQQFRSGFATDEVSLIKPSNWINSILSDLYHCKKTSKAIFMTIAPRDFLIAVLRGGSDRISYICNFLMHLQTAFPEHSHLLEQAAPLNSDPLLGAARLIMVTYHLQNKIYEEAIQNAPKENYAYLAFDDLLTQPEDSLILTAKTLDLDFQADEIRNNVNQVFKQHSKNENEKYDPRLAKQQDQKIEQDYNHIIIPALNWYQENLTD